MANKKRSSLPLQQFRAQLNLTLAPSGTPHHPPGHHAVAEQTYILSQSEQTYITAATNNGQPQYSYVYEVDGSGAVTGDYLRTSF